MDKFARIPEKYGYNGSPPLPRPDTSLPAGRNLSLITTQDRISYQHLSPDGRVANPHLDAQPNLDRHPGDTLVNLIMRILVS